MCNWFPNVIIIPSHGSTFKNSFPHHLQMIPDSNLCTTTSPHSCMFRSFFTALFLLLCQIAQFVHLFMMFEGQSVLALPVLSIKQSYPSQFLFL